MSNSNSNVRVGISGWTFPGWRGTFYPKGIKAKDELAFASRLLSAIEINGTFYRLQKPHTFQKWYDETPSDFVFAIKAPKYITHEQRLKEFDRPLANFLASGLLCLREKLGVILWQFPPTLPFIPERFEAFLAALPHTTSAAAELSKGHSDWMAERAVVTTDYVGKIRHAFEVRHESFKCPGFIEMLRKYDVAVVFGDNAGRWPYMEDLTSNFVYARLHGDEVKYPKGYTADALSYWHQRLNIWASGREPDDSKVESKTADDPSGREVFVFFDNDYKESAPFNAVAMQKLMHPEAVLTIASPAKKSKLPSVKKKRMSINRRKAG